MSFYLLKNRNPNASGGFHGHKADANKTCIVIHTAENDPSTRSAYNIGDYFTHTDRQVSYHTIIDSHHRLRLLPYGYIAFHVRNFNTHSLGLSFATRAHLWGRNRQWDNEAIALGARELNDMRAAYNIPLIRISAAQARAGVKGIVSHAQMDPTRRTDPGENFPWAQFFNLANGLQEEEEPLKLDAEDRKWIQDAIHKGTVAYKREGRGEMDLIGNAVNSMLHARSANARTQVLEAMLEELLESSGVDIDELASRLSSRLNNLTGESVVDALVERLSRQED